MINPTRNERVDLTKNYNLSRKGGRLTPFSITIKLATLTRNFKHVIRDEKTMFLSTYGIDTVLNLVLIRLGMDRKPSINLILLGFQSFFDAPCSR